jgi:Flp pilus assembly protein TadD
VAGGGGWTLLQLRPAHPTPARRAYERANSHLYRFQYSDAKREFSEALRLDPTYAVAALGRALTCLRMGSRGEADSAFARADSLKDLCHDRRDRLWIRYRVAEYHRDRSDQLAALQELRSTYPDDPRTRELEAERAQADGDLDLGTRRLQEVVEACPDRVDLLNRLGYLCLERGDYDAAIAYLRRYAFYAADAANPHDSLGEIFLATGRYFESAQEYLAAIAIDPGFSSAILGASNALLITGQLRRAENLLRTAHDQLALDGQLPRYHLSQIQILFSRERWGQLQTEVDRRLQLPEFEESNALGAALWMRTLQCVASTRQGDAELARAQRDSLLAHSAALRTALPETAESSREVLELLDSSVRATYAVRFGDRPVQRLAQLRSEVEASSLAPYQLLSFRSLLAQALQDHGLYEESLEVSETILRSHAAHPRTNLLAAQSLIELGRNDEALARLGVGLSTLRYADANLPLLEKMKRLRERLEPPSS